MADRRCYYCSRGDKPIAHEGHYYHLTDDGRPTCGRCPCPECWPKYWQDSASPQPAASTRFQEFDDGHHPFYQWWQKHGQYMMSGGGRRERIWACRGWIAREQLMDGVEVTGESLSEAAPPAKPQPAAAKCPTRIEFTCNNPKCVYTFAGDMEALGIPPYCPNCKWQLKRVEHPVERRVGERRKRNTGTGGIWNGAVERKGGDRRSQQGSAACSVCHYSLDACVCGTSAAAEQPRGGDS